jgi:hypothetical protein
LRQQAFAKTTESSRINCGAANPAAFDSSQGALSAVVAGDLVSRSKPLNIWHKVDITDARFSLIVEIQREIERKSRTAIPINKETRGLT